MTDPGTLLGATILDRYRLVEVAGRGGMAVVFKAEDVRHKRTVAIKVFRAELTRADAATRFRQEIDIIAALQHPHILPLLDSGTIGDSPYYVMPFVQGESLRERIDRNGPTTPRDAVRLLVELADALRYAHEHGLIHRDIKPENILLSGHHALLADFGVARPRPSADSRATTGGFALGTPAYMAPEQASADPNIDARVDIYALGVVAYEMLTGVNPFRKPAPAATLAAHLTEMPAPLDEVRLDISRDLAALVTRCLNKKPEDRWQTAGELHAALDALITPSGASTPAATQPISRRRRWIPAATLVLAGVAAGAVWMFFTSRTAGVTVTDTRRLSAAAELELDPVLSPDGRLLAYVAGTNGQLRLMVRQLAGGDPLEVMKDIAGNQRAPRWLADGSSLLVQASGTVYRVPALGGAPQPLISGTPADPAENAVPSPDGKEVVYTQGGELRVRAMEGGAFVTLVKDGQVHSPAWRPDGKLVAYVSGNREFALGEGLLGNIAPSVLRTISRAGGQPFDLTDGNAMAISPEWLSMQSLIYISNAGGVRDLYALRMSATGQPRGRAARLTTGLNPHTARRATDGSGLVVGVLNHASNLWRLRLISGAIASMTNAEAVTSGAQVVEDVDVLPTIGMLAFDSNREGNQDIYVLNPGSSRPLRVSTAPEDEFGPAWSPNGKELAYYAVNDGVRHIYMIGSAGGQPRQLTNELLQDQQPHWSPDGQHLVFYRRDARQQDHLFILDRTSDTTWSVPRPLINEPGTGITWSTAGEWIAYSDPEGRIQLTDSQGSPSRTVAAPAQTDGLKLKRPQWIPFSPALLARTDKPGGRATIWRVDVVTGAVFEVARIGDKLRPSFRDDFATDGQYVYFTVGSFESSVWRLGLGR